MLAVIYSSQGKDKSKLLWNIVLRIPGTSKPHKFSCYTGLAMWVTMSERFCTSSLRLALVVSAMIAISSSGILSRSCWGPRRRWRSCSTHFVMNSSYASFTSSFTTCNRYWINYITGLVALRSSILIWIISSVITSTISSWVPEMPTEVVLWPCTWANRSNISKVTGYEEKLDLAKHRPCLYITYRKRNMSGWVPTFFILTWSNPARAPLTQSIKKAETFSANQGDSGQRKQPYYRCKVNEDKKETRTSSLATPPLPSLV